MSSVRTAVLTEYGQPPTLQDRKAPQADHGQAVVEVHAAPITPLDVLCASGTSYFGAPPLPYVPGVQGVGVIRTSGTIPAGTPVWFSTAAGMRAGDGSMASLVAVPDGDIVALINDVPATLVAALGLSAIAAWMALVWRGELREGEQVVVLGAGGVVGQVALQVARARGARRVVAACRSDAAAERAVRRGADDVVRLDTDDVATLARRLQDACDGPADVVLDPLFGAPAAAALHCLRPYGRLVNLGSSAAPTAAFDSATLRSQSLRILGYTNNELNSEQRANALAELLALAADGTMGVDYEAVPLEAVSSAWRRQADGVAASRLVVEFPPAGA